MTLSIESIHNSLTINVNMSWDPKSFSSKFHQISNSKPFRSFIWDSIDYLPSLDKPFTLLGYNTIWVFHWSETMSYDSPRFIFYSPFLIFYVFSTSHLKYFSISGINLIHVVFLINVSSKTKERLGPWAQSGREFRAIWHNPEPVQEQLLI